MIRDDMTNEEYHAHHALSSSDVKMVYTKTLAHWKAKEYKRTAAFDLGTAVHAMLLEPEKNLVRCGPETRRGNAWKDAYAEAEAEGAVLLPEAEYNVANAMREAVLYTKAANSLVSDPNMLAEQSIFADHTSGQQIKCRPDGLIAEKGIIFDIKTTQDASPRGFAREVEKYAYSLQASFYLTCANLAGIEVDRFIFVAVEKDGDYQVGCHELDPEYMLWANDRVNETLDLIKSANDTDDFSTGWPVLNKIKLPHWLVA